MAVFNRIRNFRGDFERTAPDEFTYRPVHHPWLLASYVVVFGIVYFRDKDVVIEADSISAEDARIDVGLE